MNWKTRTALAVAIAQLAAAQAQACSVCGCGDPLVQAGDSTQVTGSWQLSLETEYLTASAKGDSPEETESLTQLTLRPIVVFSPVGSLNLVLLAPLLRKDLIATGPDGSEATAHSGIGDLDLGARWFFFEQVRLGRGERDEAALTAGTSLPIGSNDATVDGVRVDEHAQIGSGSFGPYVGAFWASHLRRWTWLASVTARTHTRNDEGYRYGSALLASASTQYRVGDRVALGLGIDARYAARDRLGSELEENTGGAVVSLTSTISLDLEGALWLSLRAQVPIVHALFGSQSVGPVLAIALQFSPS